MYQASNVYVICGFAAIGMSTGPLTPDRRGNTFVSTLRLKTIVLTRV